MSMKGMVILSMICLCWASEEDFGRGLQPQLVPVSLIAASNSTDGLPQPLPLVPSLPKFPVGTKCDAQVAE